MPSAARRTTATSTSKAKRQESGAKASITRFLAEKLKLKVNAAKSAVAEPWKRKFLGYSLTWHKAPKRRIAPESRKRQKDKIRAVPIRERAQPDESHRRTQPDPARLGGVFQADRNQAGAGRDGWLDQAETARHPVATVETPLYSRQKLDEGGADGRASIPLGVQPTRAVVEQWRQPHERLPKSFFDRLGLVSLLDTMRRLQCVQ